jgi:hypothetical protein
VVLSSGGVLSYRCLPTPRQTARASAAMLTLDSASPQIRSGHCTRPHSGRGVCRWRSSSVPGAASAGLQKRWSNEFIYFWPKIGPGALAVSPHEPIGRLENHLRDRPRSHFDKEACLATRNPPPLVFAPPPKKYIYIYISEN